MNGSCELVLAERLGRKERGQPGFTLIELLVVIAVIGILVGLLLPAVQFARETARRMQCQSHLKQISLSALNFESTHHRFPSGGWGFQWQGYSDISSIAGQSGSWTYSLLPYLEQESLYELGTYQAPSGLRDQQLRRRVSSAVPVYNCPSRRGSEPALFDPSCASCASPIGVDDPLQSTVRGDYAANAGDGVPDLSALGSWPSTFWGPADVAEATVLSRSNGWPKPPLDWSGISWLARSVRLSDLTDGTSHTILFGEKYVRQDAYYTGIDWGDNEPLYGGFNNDNHRSTHPAFPLMRDRRGVISIGSFGSAHSSVVNFAMSDGSVHSIAYAADLSVFRHLGNRHDGMSVSIP